MKPNICMFHSHDESWWCPRACGCVMCGSKALPSRTSANVGWGISAKGRRCKGQGVGGGSHSDQQMHTRDVIDFV